MNLKKNYIEIINENSDYNFNKELLQIIKTSVNSDTINSDNINSDTINNDNINSDTINNDNFTNYIFYGPSCSYKYKNALKLLQHFSPSNLKYEKKLHINLVKTDFYIKIRQNQKK